MSILHLKSLGVKDSESNVGCGFSSVDHSTNNIARLFNVYHDYYYNFYYHYYYCRRRM